MHIETDFYILSTIHNLHRHEFVPFGKVVLKVCLDEQQHRKMKKMRAVFNIYSLRRKFQTEQLAKELDQAHFFVNPRFPVDDYARPTFSHSPSFRKHEVNKEETRSSGRLRL